MKFLLKLPVIRNLHARQLLLPAVVLLVVVGVLLHGALNREPAAEASESREFQLPSPPSLLSLRPALEKNPLTYQSDYWLQLAEQSTGKIILIGRGRFPGVVVASGIVLSSIQAADDVVREQRERLAAREFTSAEPAEPAPSKPSLESGLEEPLPEEAPEPPEEAEPERYKLLAVDAELGVSLFELRRPYPGAPFTLLDPTTLKPGSYLVAVTLAPDERIQVVPGYLVSPHPVTASPFPADSFDLSIAFPRSARTAAIMDLDGHLLGVAVNTGEQIRLFSSETVLHIVDRLREAPPCRSIETATLSEDLKDLLRVRDGVVIERVRRDAFLPEPSVRPGDVLLQWNRQPVADSEHFQRLYDEQEPGELARYVVLRGRKRVSGATRMPGRDCRPVGEPLTVFPAIGLTLQWELVSQEALDATAEGWRVLTVAEGSPAANAAIQPDDWILAVDGANLTRRNAEQPLQSFEARPQAIALTIQRGERVKLLAVSPLSE